MDTLVLDVSYQPRQCVSWQQVMVWVVKKTVVVVEEHPDRYIRTPSWTVNMPSVVRFLRTTPRKKAIKFSRQNVYLRDQGKCQYCGHRTPRHLFTYDHVTPRSQGGTTCWENVVVSCIPCNQQKANRTPAQAGMPLRTQPVRPKKLPDLSYLAMTYKTGMPASWRTWLRDAVYWEGTLEE